jgi:putative hydrolase of the HAD superfamily
MKKFAGIRAVTFDVGNTLIEAWPSVGHVYAEVAAAHGHRGMVPAELNRRFRAAFYAFEGPVNSKPDWARIVDATFAAWLPRPAIEKIFPDLYDRFAQPDAWKIYEDVEPALRALRERGLALGVISNWDDRLRPLLHALRLAERFDAIVISCETGASKPAPAIFAAAAKELGVPAAALLHVGDDWEKDVAGANAAGAAGVQVERRARILGEAQIGSLVDLLACLGNRRRISPGDD